MLSRVADSLYWMSRYLERAEHTARLLSVRLDTMVQESEAHATQSWLRVAAALGDLGEPGLARDPAALTQRLAFDKLNRSSVLSSVRAARDNARAVREQISSEMWEHLNRFHLSFMQASFAQVWAGQPASFFRRQIEELFLFQGLTLSTMRHGEGWHFIALGRHIERAQLVSRLLDVHFGAMPANAPEDLAPPSYFDWIALLKQCTAFEAYCKVYTARIAEETIAEFLVFDAELPYSLRHAADRIKAALDMIGSGASPRRRAACDRLAGRLQASLEYGQVGDLMGGRFDAFLRDIQQQCEQIHHAVHDAYIAYGVEGAVPV